MARDDWCREVTITGADLAVGDWESRDRNSLALAFARVLRPGTTVFVDVDRGEYFLTQSSHLAWFGLPDEFLSPANRVLFDGSRDELSDTMSFPSWALPTERWTRKQQEP